MKKFLVFVLVCLVLCNSVLADFEDISSDSVSSSVSVDSSSSDSGDMEVAPVETQVPLEEVDQIVDLLPPLDDSAFEVDSSGEVPPEVTPGGNTVYVLGQPFIDDSEVDENDGFAPSYPVITASVVATGLAPVTPSDTTGLKAVLLSFIGTYDPPVVQYEYSTSNNYKQYVNEIQPDYVWICSFALIALFIYCLFKLGGALLRG